jgi:predicted AlkP superfamily pyrophosphatase or phosphodiesterase
MSAPSNGDMLKRLATLCLAFAAAAAPLFAQTHQPVLVISIDGLRPDYVTQADQHHLRIPYLRRMLADGSYAEGVQGVFPTVTYPSHTTLVTGVWPAEHGILNNGLFDPEHTLSGAWYWYADDIKVTTLWSAARAAGLHTASVSWPVTADSSSIDTLIPEYWRSASPGDALNPDDRFLMDALSRPDGEVARIRERSGVPYMMGNDTTIEGDETRTVYSLDILKQHRPEFMTIHLSSLDEEEHLHAPFSEEADKDLEALDGMIGRLAAQELRNYPNAAIAVVSDHGFAPVHSSTNLYVPFLAAGLIQTGTSAGGAMVVKSWKAQPWLGGGMAAIMLHDPADAETRDRVHELLTKLAADPANGIEAVLSRDEMRGLGGFPDAAFVVTLKPGYNTGANLTGPLVSDTAQKGTHGYSPATTPEMRASFFIVGGGVAHGKDLGVIDMRQIAPTLAGVLGVALPTAQQKPLPIH